VTKTPNKKLREFFRNLDRQFFIDNDYKQFADQDRPLPIGFHQTISQPSLVLYMTLELDVNQNHKVLEIGTGSGYQTAFLAEFAQEVYTIEIIEELSKKARLKLMELGYTNVNYKIGDGTGGWPEFAPYDRIIITAGAREIPQKLWDQLKYGGRMVIPVGKPGLQDLLLISKNKEKGRVIKSLGEVRFVEFKGSYGWKNQ